MPRAITRCVITTLYSPAVMGVECGVRSDEAVDRYREEKRLDEADDDESDAELVGDHVDTPQGPAPSGRIPRVHHPPVRYNPEGVNYLTDMDDLYELIEAARDDLYACSNDYKKTVLIN